MGLPRWPRSPDRGGPELLPGDPAGAAGVGAPDLPGRHVGAAAAAPNTSTESLVLLDDRHLGLRPVGGDRWSPGLPGRCGGTRRSPSTPGGAPKGRGQGFRLARPACDRHIGPAAELRDRARDLTGTGRRRGPCRAQPRRACFASGRSPITRTGGLAGLPRGADEHGGVPGSMLVSRRADRAGVGAVQVATANVLIVPRSERRLCPEAVAGPVPLEHLQADEPGVVCRASGGGLARPGRPAQRVVLGDLARVPPGCGRSPTASAGSGAGGGCRAAGRRCRSRGRCSGVRRRSGTGRSTR